MNKKFLLIIIFLLSINFAAAAITSGVWNTNHQDALTITNGETPDFEYRVQSVSSYKGVTGTYSIMLYQNSNLLHSYFYGEPSIGNGAIGNITVQSSEYQNSPGEYYLIIFAVDYFGAYSKRLNLTVVANVHPLRVSCSADPVSGTVPLSTNFTASVSGGSGVYNSYSWNFNDGNTQLTSSNNVQHKYNNYGNYKGIVTVTDNQGNSETAQCPEIIVKPINLSVSCSASPTSGMAPLGVNFFANPSGGSGNYVNYAWNYKDGSSQNTNTNTVNHIYQNSGTYHASITVLDSNNNIALADCPTITVNPQPPRLNVTYINCFDTVIKGQNQSCQVFVKDNNNAAVGNAYVDIYYIDDGLFGSCITDELSGGCAVYRTMNTIGRFTVYATANKPGYINDTDSWPRKTFDVYDHRYDIINLNTYNDSLFLKNDKDFFRGEALYVKFQIYDIINHVFITSDVVTDASLVSAPGGRADMTKMNFNDNWYYYKLDQIPLNHDFLGESNVFAFAFNLSEQTGGQAQTDLIIRNNPPVISPLPDMEFKVGENKTLNLYEYGYDLEDKRNLNWVIASSNYRFTATIKYINGQPILSIKAVSSGITSLALKAYDLDNDFDTGIINIKISDAPNSLIASCNAVPTSGIAPLKVNFSATASGGSGAYSYEWRFKNNQAVLGGSHVNYTYSEGIYYPNIRVNDSQGRSVTVDCPKINVTKQTYQNITGTCYANPKTGTAPLRVEFLAVASSGNGVYSYTWIFDDGAINNTNNNQIEHIYGLGMFYPKVRIKDSQGRTGLINCPPINACPSYTLSCRANPTSGTAPLNVRLIADVKLLNVIDPDPNHEWSYEWAFDDNGIVLENGKEITHLYRQGTFTPKVIARKDNIVLEANCPTINVGSGTLLKANPGGPYKGYTNEALRFDGSLSTGNIVKYVWNFGDGTILESTSTYIDYIYVNKIGRFNVTLTVYDGLTSDSAMTTATIIERTNFKVDEDDSISNELYFEKINYYGLDGIYEHAKSDDDVTFDLRLHNHGSYKLNDARIIIEIPELGIKQKSAAFDLSAGAQKSESMAAQFYNVPKGMYYVKIIVQDDNIKHVKFREIYVGMPTKCISCK